jgi:hypothetical protein
MGIAIAPAILCNMSSAPCLEILPPECKTPHPPENRDMLKLNLMRHLTLSAGREWDLIKKSTPLSFFLT